MPPSGSYATPPTGEIYHGDAWAGGSGIALGLLGCACGLPNALNNPAVQNAPGVLPLAMVMLFGCGGLALWIDWLVVKGIRWAMIVSLVLIAMALIFAVLGIAGAKTGSASTSSFNVATPLSYLRMLILVFYLPLRLGRAVGPELN